MTVAVTPERLDKTLALLKRRADKGQPCPTNLQIALTAGLGEQKFQPWDRMRGIRTRKPEAGAVLIRRLEEDGLIAVKRFSNLREITIIETGQVLRSASPVRPGRSRNAYETLRLCMEREGWLSAEAVRRKYGLSKPAMTLARCIERGWRAVQVGRYVFVQDGVSIDIHWGERRARFADTWRAFKDGRVPEVIGVRAADACARVSL